MVREGKSLDMIDGGINTNMARDESMRQPFELKEGEYVSAVKWENMVNEIRFQYAKYIAQ